jgi:ferrous iron transport protein A
MTALSEVPAGRRARICDIRAGRALKGRLMSMGLRPGVEIRVMRAAHGGPVMIAREDCRIAIGVGMSSKILVEEL